MLVAKSELAFCSHARRLTNAGFAEVFGLTGGHRERLGGGAADFATSISVGSRPWKSEHGEELPVDRNEHDGILMTG